jgi:hypothetical protein
MICPTIRVKDDRAPGGHVVINESDYDPLVHQRVESVTPLADRLLASLSITPPPKPPTTQFEAATNAPSTHIPLTVSRGPRGMWFVKRGVETVSTGFAAQEAAQAEADRLSAL